LPFLFSLLLGPLSVVPLPTLALLAFSPRRSVAVVCARRPQVEQIAVPVELLELGLILDRGRKVGLFVLCDRTRRDGVSCVLRHACVVCVVWRVWLRRLYRALGGVITDGALLEGHRR